MRPSRTICTTICAALFALLPLRAAADAPADEPDHDGDGVSDYEDYCPNTPAGRSVWLPSHAASGQAQPTWVGCAGLGDTNQPPYTPPSRPVPQTYYDRAHASFASARPMLGDDAPAATRTLTGSCVFAGDPDHLRDSTALFGWIDDPVLGRILKIQFRDGGASPRTGVHVVDVAADGHLGGFDGVFDDNVDNYPYHCDVRKSDSSSSFFASCEYDFCNIYDYLDGAIPVCWDPAHAQEICWYQLAR
jgi:hypothetical protein